MATDPFRSFLCIEICQDLVSSDIKAMSFCIRSRVNSQELENVTTGPELMDLAMKAGLFTETDTSELETMLNAAARKDLVQKVKEYKNIRVLPSQCAALCNLEENMIGRLYMETKTSDELKTAIQTDNVIILSGVLGSGKTQLAVHYGYEFHNNDPSSTVWIMRSKDQASLQTSMTTLANKLDILKGKDKDSDNPINALGDIIANALIGKETTTSHIIIFDDVNEDCRRIVEDLIKKLLPLKEPRGSIKVIVTTMDDLLTMPRAKRILVSGFTEKEAITFLSGNKPCNDSEKDALEILAKRMSNLPLGLSCVKTYMVNCYISGNFFLKLLDVNTLQKLDGKLAQLDDGKRGLFSDLNTLIRIMEKDLDEDASEMFRMTQFLENENIPIILFELLSPSSARCSEDADQDIEHDNVETCYSLSTDSLVQAVQKFSLGTVQGIDDRRMLNTHTAVSLTLQAFTDDEKKRRLLKRLLWPFALIMDKNNRHPDDYNRMVAVLPHARSILLHAETLMKEEDVELCLLMSFINDLVAYTNNFEGLVELEKRNSEKALQYCYKIMETTEKEMNEKVFAPNICTSAVAHREFAKAKATAIDQNLTEIRLLHEQDIAKFMKHFILQRKRTQADVKFLTEYLENYDGEALTMQQYETLCEQKKAVPLTDLMDHFIIEMIMSTFYTYGRRIVYIGRCADIDEKRKCIHYLYLADAFGEILRSKYPEFIPLYCMLAKISGTVELVFEDMPELNLATVNNLRDTAEMIEQLLNDPSDFYIFGIFKLHAASDSIHKATCLKQLLRTYMKLFKLCKNTSDDKTETITKGKGIIEKLESIEIVSYDSKNRGIWSRVGEFQFAVGDTKDAEISYMRVCPPCLLEGDVKSRFVSKHELTSAYGLVDCYNKEEKTEQAKCTLQKLLKMLPDTQMQENENVRKRIGLLERKN